MPKSKIPLSVWIERFDEALAKAVARRFPESESAVKKGRVSDFKVDVITFNPDLIRAIKQEL